MFKGLDTMSADSATNNKQSWKQIVVTAVVFALIVAVVLSFLSVPAEQVAIAVPVSTVLYFVFSHFFSKHFIKPNAN